MCNAWNHPKNCNCGWGGESNAGRASSKNCFFPSGFLERRPISKSYESYTIPNARCPICEEEVFFYQSQDGGRVFFDSLGPPWPKHSCTNRTKTPLAHSRRNRNEKKQYQWQIDGWKPVFKKVLSVIDKYWMKMVWEGDGERESVYFRKKSGRNIEKHPVFNSVIMYIKYLDRKECEIYILNNHGIKIKFKAYESLTIARERDFIVRTNHNGKKLSRSKKIIHVKNRNDTQRETSMSIAFNKAKKEKPHKSG